MAIYPYAHGCGPDPKKTIDKYWKYKNPDPSTAKNATIVANEIFSEIQEKISERGKQIYSARPKAIIVQDLHHEVIRQLAKMLNEEVKHIEQYEKENSGDIRNYFDSEEQEDQNQS